MIKFILLLISIFLSKNFLFSQENYKNYYAQVSQAYEEIALKNHQNAIQIFESTFTNFYPFTDDLKALAKCYLVTGNKEKAYESMKRMILSGYKLESTLPLVNSNTAQGNFKTTTGVGDSILEKQLLIEYSSLRNEYVKKIDWQLNNYLSILSYFEVHTSLMRKQCDSDKTYSAIENYGFGTEKDMLMNLLKSDLKLKREVTDSWESNDFLVMLIHCSQSLTNQQETDLFFDLLKKQVNEGNLSNLQYASIIDNNRYRSKKGSLYGQQFRINSKTGERELTLIEDIQNVDNRRLELGLPPLWVWCELYNIQVPIDYKKK